MPSTPKININETAEQVASRVAKYIAKQYPLESPAESLARLTKEERMSWLGTLNNEELRALEYDWNFHARPKQRNPNNNKWKILMFLSGRGYGKTRSAAEVVRGWIESGKKRHVALVAANAADLRDIMVENVLKQGSGMMQICPPWNRPEYSVTHKTLTWPNGAVCSLYSAEEPDGLRGPSHDGAWIDEWAKMKYGETVMHMLKLTMRLPTGTPQIVISTTPKNVPFLVKFVQEAQLSKSTDTIIVKGSTYENRANLASDFILDIAREYEGTNLGRQEIYADLLLNIEGALWSMGLIDMFRITNPQAVPSLRQVVIAVDPQTGYKRDKDLPVKKLSRVARSTLTGIMAIGSSMPIRGQSQHAYVLEDGSMNGKPEEWAAEVVRMNNFYSQRWRTRIIAEANQGGEMIRSVIQNVDPSVQVFLVNANAKKHERAIPVVAKYEKGLVHHVGTFGELESEMTLYEPGDEDEKLSPNRMDALVHGVRFLLIDSIRSGAGIALSRPI